MRKIKVLKDCKYYQTGQIVIVSNNEAHSLIDCGCAKLDDGYSDECARDYEDKMMRPRKRN